MNKESGDRGEKGDGGMRKWVNWCGVRLSDIPVWKDHLTAEPRNPALLIERHLSDPLAMFEKNCPKGPMKSLSDILY